MRDRASELRAIAGGRLVTVSRSMLAMIADELDAERAAHAETKRERDEALKALEPLACLRKVAEEAFWLLAWNFQSHLHRHGEPFDMSIFAPEARDLMNKGEQNLFDALSALSSENDCAHGHSPA